MDSIDETVDFAIITALKIERDAVLSRLESVQQIQEDDDPHTYYLGSISNPKSNLSYKVVVVMLLGMGNDEAAVSTTMLMNRWKPQNIMMVGIAGGVKGEVKLGDVVIAEFSHYHELGKITTKGRQSRPQQFRSDRMLFGRAKSYEASEWKGEINLDRPGVSEENIPEAHFGPIGAGEDVIGDEKFLTQLLRECPKMLAVAMEGAGVARAAATTNLPARFLEVRGICDYADSSKNDAWHSYAANAAAAFVTGYLRSRPVSPDSENSESTKSKKRSLLMLRMQSLRAIGSDEIFEALDDELKTRDLEAVGLDLTDLVRSDRVENPQVGVTRLLDEKGPFINALNRGSEFELIFHGLAHIPFVALSGYIITDRQPVRLFDFHPAETPPTWAWTNDLEAFPPMSSKGLPAGKIRRCGEVVIRISVSYKAEMKQTRAVVPAATVEVDLSVPAPKRDIVKSEKQIHTYGRQFREVLDAVVNKMPDCPRIHIFYAGPVALAFHIGQQISQNIHPPVTVWNFRQGKYEWGIDFTAASDGEPSVVQPAKKFEGE